MAFPTTSVLDNFNRANGPIGSNWTNDTIGAGSTAFNISATSRLDNGAGTYGEMYWNPATYGPDSEAFIKILALGDGSEPSLGLMVRCQSPGSAACDGYRLQVRKPVATWEWDLYEVTNGSEGATMDSANQAIAVNDQIGLEIIGSTIKAYHHNGTSWSEILSASDSTISSAGNLGVWAYNGSGASLNWFLDDFGGGTVVGGGTDYDADPNAAASTASGPTPGVTTLTRPYVLTTIS